MLGATPVLLSYPDVMDQLPKGFGDGFAMHLVFCHGLGLMGYFHSHTLFQGGIMMAPIGVLWNTAKYNACKNIVGQDVMDAAAALWLSTVYGGVATDTVGAYEWMLSHNDTVVTLNSTQTAVWADAVASYVEDWKNACDDPELAADIYDTAKAYIAALEV
jgi:TRAP-type C4-dicarboxylate transport system substrate-binding protein